MTNTNTDTNAANKKKASRKPASPWYADGGLQTAAVINPADHETAQTAYARSFDGLEADAFAVGASSDYGTWTAKQKQTFLALLWAIPVASIAFAAFVGFVLTNVQV